MSNVLIEKMDGTREPFKEEKLRASLQSAGASKREVNSVVSRITKELYPGMSTEIIYQNAFQYLNESNDAPAASRYSLRRALFGLGPTGFPFEDFLARLFEYEGYTVSVGVHIEGKCATHEIDLAAYTETDSFIAEAKFHSRPGLKSDLKVVMYSHARKLDLMGAQICNKDVCGIQHAVVVTNTKFTSTAKAYAQCVHLELLSWDHPRGATLHDRIDAHHLYPITVLQTLSNAQKGILLERGVILCRDILARPAVIRHLHISEKKAETVFSEARQLCDDTK